MSDKQRIKSELKRDMLLIYGVICWGDMFWEEDHKNILTMHHIKPKREGGKLIWRNTALLSLYFHQLFNQIERVDRKLAEELNDLFIELNKSMSPPKEQHYSDVVFLTDKAEYKHGLVLKK